MLERGLDLWIVINKDWVLEVLNDLGRIKMSLGATSLLLTR